MGSSTRRPPAGNCRAHATGYPCAHSAPSDSSNTGRSSCCRRSDPTATPGRPDAPSTSSTDGSSSGCGLISTNVPYPSAISAPTTSANRTGCRRLSAQYAASSSSPLTRAPVTVERSGTVPVCGASVASCVSRSSRSGSTCGLWLATSTFTHRANTPRASSVCTTAPSAAGSPDSTVTRGLLLTATLTRSS